MDLFCNLYFKKKCAKVSYGANKKVNKNKQMYNHCLFFFLKRNKKLNEFLLVFGHFGGLTFVDVFFLTTPSSFLCYMWLQFAGVNPAETRLQPLSPRHWGEPSCYASVLPAAVPTYRDIWPFPLAAPWRASVFRLTSWCLEGEEEKHREDVKCDATMETCHQSKCI